MPDTISINKLEDGLDYQHPDYVAIMRQRVGRLNGIRNGTISLAALKAHYRDHIADFISDWGMTYDPRLPEVGQSAAVPFVLFQKQREWVDWVIDHWHNQRSGITEKSRELGMSWVAIAVACSLCLFNKGLSIGFGSRLQDYVDKIGEPKSLFWKARFFLEYLPEEFRGGWDRNVHAPHMRIIFPGTESVMGGESGDNIGRGDRRSIYMVDESAHLDHPESVDAALSMTTNCRIDISSVKGRSNPFAQKRFAYPPEDVFTLHWRDDPRKDEAWYIKKCAEINNPVIVAQELDIDYAASVEGVVIPSAWIQAAVDAHTKLSVVPSGLRQAAFDIADQGPDSCGFCGAYGVLVEQIEEWHGKSSDTFESVQRAFALCDVGHYPGFRYDSDGIGASVRGDARVINEQRKQSGNQRQAIAWRGSGSVFNPEEEIVPGRANKDFFANAKAQAWWALRLRFQKTFRWVTEGVACPPDQIISLSSKIPKLQKLIVELSQPTFGPNGSGHLVVDKQPKGSSSPNMADSVMMRFAPIDLPVTVTPELLAWARQRRR